jgi:hypothetical protein
MSDVWRVDLIHGAGQRKGRPSDESLWRMGATMLAGLFVGTLITMVIVWSVSVFLTGGLGLVIITPLFLSVLKDAWPRRAAGPAGGRRGTGDRPRRTIESQRSGERA